MVRKIIREPEDILRQVMPDIDDLDKARQVVRDLIDTMEASGAAGFAANQINEPYNICIVSGHYRYNHKDKSHFVFVNPKIVTRGKDKFMAGEGCYSIPGYVASIPRNRSISVAHKDLNGKDQLTNLGTNFDYGASNIAQHEIDHLLGILIRDYVEETHGKKGGKLISKYYKSMASATYKDPE